ncbi:MAG: MFS transporter [Calditrichaeota bacterium]|nr:MAG: MFS transporter [Calditrichota bacterium]MBL1205328.1 MFS transporter [Calditrichota bacterium]NOG45157.1 peptide MFS transporter [Calditrichota bacterium]
MGKHPKGLLILFFTEMWERFSFYGMRAILVLYITKETVGDNPGLGWNSAEAMALFGWYLGIVYFMSFPGGILADRFLGQKKSVLLGGLLIIAGQFSLVSNSIEMFYIGLTLLVMGVGLLKPNISTMVGGLYKEGDPRRDNGFIIFYMGINVGAFAAPLLVGYIGEVYGWHYGFGLAGIGMILGLIVYLWGQKYLEEVGNFMPTKKIEGTNTNAPLTKIEKDRVIVLLISFLIVIVFWAAYEQAGGLMNLFTRDSIDRVVFGWEIPTGMFQSVPALFVIMFGFPVAWLWSKRQTRGKETSSIFKMAIGTMVMGTGFLMLSAAVIELDAVDGRKAMLVWLVAAYLLHVIGELSLSPVALSFITKLAPLKYSSMMMGLYFAATGLGGKLAGMLGELAQHAGEFEVFTGIFVFCVLFGLLLLVFFKKLKALTHGAEEMYHE